MFIAQCLEHDICAQASTMNEVEQRLRRTIALERELGDLVRGDGLSRISAAPNRFFDMIGNDGVQTIEIDD